MFKKQLPLPPGPKPLPLIGNAKDMPKTKAYVTFAEWAKTYGPIVHLDIMGLHLIIVNDLKCAYEMLEGKGKLYSNRPTLVMAGELVGWDQSPVLIESNDTWATHRKHFASFMGTAAKVEEYEPILKEEIKTHLNRLVKTPENHIDLFQSYAGACFLRLVYGYKVVDEKDPFVMIVNDAMDGFSKMTESGAFAVDIFPALRHVPKWFPGAGWKTKAAKYREEVEKMLKGPYEWAKEQTKSGTVTSSFVTDILKEEKDLTPEKERIIQWSAAGIHAGGCLTTGASLSNFLLGVVRHTTELQKAQAEIDSVVGRDRLPTLADRPKLPYFDALCAEIHRVYPIGHIGLQHVPMEDDIYNNYLIPKGSVIIPNTWCFLNNEEMYPNPQEFNPDRYLSAERKATDPRDFSFGYGIRRCPGVHLAQAMQWLALSTLVATYDIRPVMKDGKPVIPPANFKEGLVALPEDFQYVITPRASS